MVVAERGGTTMAHHGHRHGWLSLALICLLMLAGCAGSGGSPSAHCGTWAVDSQTQDARLKPELGDQPTGAGCEGDFRVTSTTKALGILGGYTLEMTVEQSTNIKSQTWSGLPGSHANQIVPGHVSEFHALLTDPSSRGEVRLAGAITRDSLTTDAALFLIKTALAVLDLPAGCTIPADLVLAAGLGAAPALQKVGERLIAKDIPGSIDEIKHANDRYLSQAIESIKGQAPQCAVSGLANVLGAVTGIRGLVFFTKTSVNFAGWAGAVLEDSVKYQDQPPRVSLSYVLSSKG
jgi:hypothetical protein